jgi:methionine synthase II (cobalamin-independent)
MDTADLRHGVASSIGSLPHTDPRAAAAFVLERQPRLPAAPSLPNRSGRERMIAQAAWGLPGVDVLPDGSLQVDDPARCTAAEDAIDGGIDGDPFVALRAFLGEVSGRQTAIKLQLTGPVTLGLALHAVGVPDATAFAAAGAATRARARAIVAAARAAAPSAPLVAFLDEPGLTAAMHPGFPLSPTGAIDLVSGTLAALEPHATTGVHCCGPADWRVVLQAGVQVLSLPVGVGAVEHAGALGSFIERGGWVAWGAVPTAGPLGSSPERLWEQLSAEWTALTQAGCDPVLLREQALVTPACGLATHDLAQADLVLGLTNQVARRLRVQTEGMRLTVGA